MKQQRHGLSLGRRRVTNPPQLVIHLLLYKHAAIYYSYISLCTQCKWWPPVVLLHVFCMHARALYSICRYSSIHISKPYIYICQVCVYWWRVCHSNMWTVWEIRHLPEGGRAGKGFGKFLHRAYGEGREGVYLSFIHTMACCHAISAINSRCG